MDAYDATNWTGLFGAEISASAALTGLIFVAVSINLKRILEFPALPRRAFKALVMLVDVLVSIVTIDVRVWRATAPEFRSGTLALQAIGAPSGLCTMVAGLSLFGQAGGGLYWLGPGRVAGLSRRPG